MTDKEILFEYANSNNPRFFYTVFSDYETFDLLNSKEGTAEKELAICFPFTMLKEWYPNVPANMKLDAIALGCIDVIIYLALGLNKEAEAVKNFLVKYLDLTSADLKEAIQILSDKQKDLIQKSWNAYLEYLEDPKNDG